MEAPEPTIGDERGLFEKVLEFAATNGKSVCRLTRFGTDHMDTNTLYLAFDDWSAPTVSITVESSDPIVAKFQRLIDERDAKLNHEKMARVMKRINRKPTLFGRIMDAIGI